MVMKGFIRDGIGIVVMSQSTLKEEWLFNLTYQ